MTPRSAGLCLAAAGNRIGRCYFCIISQWSERMLLRGFFEKSPPKIISRMIRVHSVKTVRWKDISKILRVNTSDPTPAGYSKRIMVKRSSLKGTGGKKNSPVDLDATRYKTATTLRQTSSAPCSWGTLEPSRAQELWRWDPHLRFFVYFRTHAFLSASITPTPVPGPTTKKYRTGQFLIKTIAVVGPFSMAGNQNLKMTS